jgi:adenylate cyclase
VSAEPGTEKSILGAKREQFVMGIDFEAEGLVDGLEGEARDARLVLLESLFQRGVPLEELKRAVAESRLALLPLEHALSGEGPRYSAEEVAKRTGIEPELLTRVWRALGLPEAPEGEPVYTDEDIEAAVRAKAFLDAGLPEEGIIQVARVIGLTMAQLAAANRELIASSLRRPGDTELDVALRYAAAARQFTPLLGPMLAHAHNLHLREQIGHDVVAMTELGAEGAAGTAEVCVCFADMVGFTRLGERLPVEEVGLVAMRLAELANAVVEPPVRLVKLIGDAAMLVSSEPRELFTAALALVEAAEGEGEKFPPLRAGIAFGTALGRGGDWYGRPVNLASRVTGIARPDSVLVTEEAREAAADGFSYSFAGERRLKGIQGRVRLFRVRREENA